MRLQQAGKIDQWFAKSDGSGAVFLMNVTNPAEAHALLEAPPLGQVRMITFDIIPVGPLWPMGRCCASRPIAFVDQRGSDPRAALLVARAMARNRPIVGVVSPERQAIPVSRTGALPPSSR